MPKHSTSDRMAHPQSSPSITLLLPYLCSLRPLREPLLSNRNHAAKQ
jgi:hypothetical protein